MTTFSELVTNGLSYDVAVHSFLTHTARVDYAGRTHVLCIHMYFRPEKETAVLMRDALFMSNLTAFIFFLLSFEIFSTLSFYA